MKSAGQRGGTVLEHPADHDRFDVDRVDLCLGSHLGEATREQPGPGADLDDGACIRRVGGGPHDLGDEVVETARRR